MGYQYAWAVRYPGADKRLGEYDYKKIDPTNYCDGNEMQGLWVSNFVFFRHVLKINTCGEKNRDYKSLLTSTEHRFVTH